MENEKWLAFVFLHEFSVNILFQKILQHARFAFRQAGAHRKIGFRQIYRGVVILGHWYFSSTFMFLIER